MYGNYSADIIGGNLVENVKMDETYFILKAGVWSNVDIDEMSTYLDKGESL
jgi:hypothetical protein